MKNGCLGGKDAELGHNGVGVGALSRGTEKKRRGKGWWGRDGGVEYGAGQPGSVVKSSPGKVCIFYSCLFLLRGNFPV